MDPRAVRLIDELDLAPHPEGGHYREIWRSGTQVLRDGTPRAASTAIWFLLATGQHSRWHVVESDEIWQFAGGDPLELLTFDPATGEARRVVLGPGGGNGAEPVHVVPARVWQAARPAGRWSLATCTVSPGFDFEDFRFVQDLPGHERVFASVLSGTEELL
jgi:uncharacterized protein